MPDPFNRTKMSGDTHPPELESDLPQEGSANAADGAATPTDRGPSAGRGAKQAAQPKDHDHRRPDQGGRSER